VQADIPLLMQTVCSSQPVDHACLPPRQRRARVQTCARVQRRTNELYSTVRKDESVGMGRRLEGQKSDMIVLGGAPRGKIWRIYAPGSTPTVRPRGARRCDMVAGQVRECQPRIEHGLSSRGEQRGALQRCVAGEVPPAARCHRQAVIAVPRMPRRPYVQRMCRYAAQRSREFAHSAESIFSPSTACYAKFNVSALVVPSIC